MTATATAGKVWRRCAKCKGTGHIGMYGHVAGGTCFGCGGQGRYLDHADWREREARAAARREREAANRAARSAAPRVWAAFAEQYPAEASLIERHKDGELGYAWSAVVVFDERDANVAQALYLVREFARGRGITLA